MIEIVENLQVPACESSIIPVKQNGHTRSTADVDHQFRSRSYPRSIKDSPISSLHSCLCSSVNSCRQAPITLGFHDEVGQRDHNIPGIAKDQHRPHAQLFQ